jgi:mannose-1-phosphate guanylyltransferase
MKALIIAGGTGTRLWPLSREDRPKQLQPLIGDESLIAQTVRRILPAVRREDLWVVTGSRYASSLSGEIPEVPAEHVIAEPFPIGTNLAVGLGAVHLNRLDPDALMLVCWADAYIGNDSEFLKALKLAEEAAREADGVLLGVRPTYPATCYGYMETGESAAGMDGVYQVKRFEEKPDGARALGFLKAGNYLWNPGISVWRVHKLLDLIKKFKPEHYAALMKVQEAIGTSELESVMIAAFTGLDPEPIDTAVCEKADSMVTIPCDLAWSDLGSWDALYEIQAQGAENVSRGNVVAQDTVGCLIYGRPERLIATLGLRDLVIVDAGDAILITRREDASRLKELHGALKKSGKTDYL